MDWRLQVPPGTLYLSVDRTTGRFWRRATEFVLLHLGAGHWICTRWVSGRHAFYVLHLPLPRFRSWRADSSLIRRGNGTDRFAHQVLRFLVFNLHGGTERRLVAGTW